MIKDRWSIDDQERHPIVLTWRFQITSHLKNQGKAMSMNEIRSHLVSKIYVVVINIFSHNWVIQLHRVEEPWTRFRAGYCWRGEKRAGQTTSHPVRIRLWVFERGARISLFSFYGRRTQPRRFIWRMRGLLPMFANLLKTSCYQQRYCFA